MASPPLTSPPLTSPLSSSSSSAAGTPSSFKRVGAKSASAPFSSAGVRQGLHGQFLVSTGLKDLDHILGGGLPLGSLILFVEDSYSPHHLLFLRTFMGQGIVHDQPLFFASSLPKPNLFLSTLPSPEKPESKSKPAGAVRDRSENDGLRIAWQYRSFVEKETALQQRRNLSINLQSQHEYCSEFNWKKNMEKIYYSNAQKIEYFNTIGEESSVLNLNECCKEFLKSYNQKNEVSRMVITNLFSPECEYLFRNKGLDLLMWIHALRGMIRNSNCVAFLTLPPFLLDPSFIHRIFHLMDAVITIEAVHDEDKTRGIGEQIDVLGKLRINKLPSMNTQAVKQIAVRVYEIVMGKKRCVSLRPIDVMAFEDHPSDDKTTTTKQVASTLCSSPSPSNSPLDF